MSRRNHLHDRVLLVITADDLGIDSRRDDGILAAFAAGGITQASLMVGGPTAIEATRRADDAGLRLGLHLDFSDLPPLAPQGRIPTLLNAQGRKLGKHGLRLALARRLVNLMEVVAEAEAQLDAFEVITGRPARHIDSHQHFHWQPQVAEALAPMLARRGVRTIRGPRPVTVGEHGGDFYAQACREAECAGMHYRNRGIQSTDGFVGLNPNGATGDPAQLARAVLAHRGESMELMCHVGFAAPGGDEFNRSRDRERELDILRSRPFAHLAAQGAVELVSFEELYCRGAL